MSKIIRVEVKNKILGDCIFWEGEPSRIGEIENICALMTAKRVVQDGVSRSDGMWHVSMVEAAPPLDNKEDK